MTTVRTYGDPCAAARALDLIGERWALMIVRELLYGSKRYSDLQAGLPNASPTVLSQRLRDLEEGGVIERRRLGAPARAWVYRLTEWGHDLEPVMVLLGRWGMRSPERHATAPLSLDSLMLALQSHLDPARLDGLDATFLITLEDDPFTVRVTEGKVSIRRGEPDRPDATVHTDPDTFTALVIDGRPATELTDGLQISGDPNVLAPFLTALTRHPA